MPLVTVDASSLKDAANGLRAAEKRLTVEDKRENKALSTEVAGWLRDAATSGSPLERHIAGAFRPRTSATSARVAVLATGRNAAANVAVFGMERRTGWNARNVHSRPQGPRWIGKSWDVTSTSGPYVARRVIPQRIQTMRDRMADARSRALSAAFPEGGTP